MKKYILPIATAVLLIVGCNKDFLNVSDFAQYLTS